MRPTELRHLVRTDMRRAVVAAPWIALVVYVAVFVLFSGGAR